MWLSRAAGGRPGHRLLARGPGDGSPLTRCPTGHPTPRLLQGAEQRSQTTALRISVLELSPSNMATLLSPPLAFLRIVFPKTFFFNESLAGNSTTGACLGPRSEPGLGGPSHNRLLGTS